MWAPGVWHVSQPGLPHTHPGMPRMSSEHLQVRCYRHALLRGDTGTQRHHTSCSPSPQKSWRKKRFVSGRSGNTAWAAGWLVGWKRQTCQSQGLKNEWVSSQWLHQSIKDGLQKLISRQQNNLGAGLSLCILSNGFLTSLPSCQ